MPASAPESFNEVVASKDKRLDAIFKKCHEDGWEETWLFTDLFILVTGLLANVALLWLFLWERKSLSASKVLGLNLVVMDLVYLSIMPISMIYQLVEQEPGRNTNGSVLDTASQNPNTTDIMEDTIHIFSMFNLIGCPLLLTCMCIERYLAVIRPVLYLRVRKWEYRMAVSVVVWTFTLCFCLTTGLTQDMTVMMVPVSVIISSLFVIMLACLGSMVWSLGQQSPAHTTHGNQSRAKSPLKKRAVRNVLVVMVPSVIVYCPMLAMLPLYFYVFYGNKPLCRDICYGFELSAIFPRLGVLIAPLFYLSKARQMCCLSGTGKTFNE